MPLIETARGAIHYKDYRSQDVQTPLVLVHGAGGHYLNWPIEMRYGLRAIALDLPGHGRSPGKGQRYVADYARDVLALLDALSIPQAVIAGHSMGGAIALTLALDYGDRVQGLILAGTGAHLPVNELIINGIVEEPRETAQTIMKWSWAKHLRGKFAAQAVDDLLQTPPAIIQRDYLACNDFDVRDRPGEVQAPTLILAGTIDKMTPLAWAEALAEGIPDSQLVTIADGGHMFPLEQPAVVAAAVREWLRVTFDWQGTAIK